MKILSDSSVLIAAFVESHSKHKSALSFLLEGKNKKFDLLVSAHTIAEVYSVLTSAPFKPKITPQIAQQLIENNIKDIAEIVYLIDNDYFRVIERMSNSNFSGGIVYDALIVECALKARADEIATLNTKDFIRLTNGQPIKIKSL